MYVIKKFIKEKMDDRLFRALFLSAVVFALMASFSCPLSILRPFFGLFVSASLYFVPVWLPSKFQIREQRETKIGVHPIAWAIWQSGYCFITIMYLLIIINTSHTGIPVWSFAFPAVVGSGYLVSYGDKFIIENRLSDSMPKAQYNYAHALMLLTLLCLSLIMESGLFPESALTDTVATSLEYSEIGEAIGLVLLERKLLKKTHGSI